MIFLRNLMRTKVRSLLTLLGVTVGTALFVSIASLTLDMHHQFTYMTAAYNTEVMIGSGNALTPFRSRISQQQVEALQATLGQTVSPMIIGNTATGGLNPLTLLGVSEQVCHDPGPRRAERNQRFWRVCCTRACALDRWRQTGACNASTHCGPVQKCADSSTPG